MAHDFSNRDKDDKPEKKGAHKRDRPKGIFNAKRDDLVSQPSALTRDILEISRRTKGERLPKITPRKTTLLEKILGAKEEKSAPKKPKLK